MKKLFTITLAVLALTFAANAQSFQILDMEGVNITGSSSTIATTLSESSDLYFEVKNVSGSQKEVRIRTVVIGDQCDGANHVVCSPITETNITGYCAMPWAELSATFTLNPNEISGEVHVEYSQGNNNGVSAIKYEIFDKNNESDMVSFTVTYSSLTAVDLANVNSFNVYPNPAVDNFTIVNEFSATSYVEIYNVLGKVVRTVKADSNTVQIDCSKWQSGYYFCRLYNDGKVEKTIKMVVTD